jgi:hypothetical protein
VLVQANSVEKANWATAGDDELLRHPRMIE